MTLLFAAIYVAVAVQISNLCTTIYLHRFLAHSGLKLKPVVSVSMQFWLWFHTGIKPRQWVAVHRKHHQFSDEHGDPHSPRLEGLWKVLLANTYLYQKEAGNTETVSRYTRDIAETRMERHVTRHGNIGIVLGVLLAVLLLGPLAGVLAFLVQAALYLILNGMINGACHVLGYRNFDNTATNIRWVALLTAGEGLHNNHHHSPSSAKLSLRRSEIDPAWPVIRLLQFLRLAEARNLLKTTLPSNPLAQSQDQPSET